MHTSYNSDTFTIVTTVILLLPLSASRDRTAHLLGSLVGVQVAR
jgi:hypothetical protein